MQTRLHRDLRGWHPRSSNAQSITPSCGEGLPWKCTGARGFGAFKTKTGCHVGPFPIAFCIQNLVTVMAVETATDQFPALTRLIYWEKAQSPGRLGITIFGQNAVPAWMEYVFLAVLLGVIIYFGNWLFVPSAKGSARFKHLPGPPTNIFGHHAGQFDPVAPFQSFQKWADQYGKMFMVKLGSQPIISINDPVLAKELFEKRGSNYSSRLAPYVGYELLSQKRRIGFTPSGDKHKAFRRQIQAILSITKAKSSRKFQELESRQLLHEILKWSEEQSTDYDQVLEIIRRYTASVMTTLAFGHRVSALNDNFVRNIFAIMADFAAACQPGRYYVDIFPILKKLPYSLRYWEHEVKNKLRWQWTFLGGLLNRVEEQKAKGIANAGLIRAMINERENLTEVEREAKFLDDRCIGYQAMTIMEAGSDTTSNTLMNFLLAMTMHPEIMEKGQECVDAHCASSELPGFDEVSQMPYVLQIAKETIRWRPAVIMGVPHASINDDVVDGYHIPGGSVVYGNIWYMHNNPAQYHDPTRFMPERYEGYTKLAFESSNEPDALARDNYTFG